MDLDKLERDCMKILCHICENVDEKNIYSMKKKKKKKIEEDLHKYKKTLYYTENYEDIRKNTGLAKSTIMIKCSRMKQKQLIVIIEDSKYINIIPSKEAIEFLESLKYRNRSKSDQEYKKTYKKLDEDTWFYQEVLKILLNNVNKYNLSWNTYTDFMEGAGMTHNEVKETIYVLEQEGFIERIRRNTKIVYVIKDWTERIMANEI